MDHVQPDVTDEEKHVTSTVAYQQVAVRMIMSRYLYPMLGSINSMSMQHVLGQCQNTSLTILILWAFSRKV